MIGKYEWFKRRKYTGWGFTPATWQGWVYFMAIIIPVVLVMNVGIMGRTKVIFLIVWGVIFLIDFIDIMWHLPKDERERVHEAIAERNALWAVMLVLAVGFSYQAASGAVKGVISIDPVIIVAVIAGLVAKIISNIYLDRKN